MFKRAFAVLTAFLCAASAGSSISAVTLDDGWCAVNETFEEDGISYTDDGSGGWIASFQKVTTADCVIPEQFQGGPVTEIQCLNPQPNIVSLRIPASVITFDVWFFSYFANLQEFRVSPENEILSSADGVLYDKSGETLIMYPPARDAAAFTVPEGVQTIGQYAFDGCQNLAEITLPESLNTIEEYAFAEIPNLTELTVPAQVTLIDAQHFDSALQTVTICCEDDAPLWENSVSASDPVWGYGSMFRDFHGAAAVYVPDAALESYQMMFDTAIREGVIAVLPMREKSETRDELVRLEDASPYYPIGEFLRRTMQLRGILDENAPRITAEQVAEILQDDPSPDEIVEKMCAIHGYPDYLWHGDPTHYEYWLDDKGREKIVLAKEIGVLYQSKICADGTICGTSFLYPPELTFESVSGLTEDVDRFYIFYNQIPHDYLNPVSGDVNHDSMFNLADAVTLKKWLLGVPNPKYINMEAADLNQDGVLNAADLSLMKSMLLERYR